MKISNSIRLYHLLIIYLFRFRYIEVFRSSKGDIKHVIGQRSNRDFVRPLMNQRPGPYDRPSYGQGRWGVVCLIIVKNMCFLIIIVCKNICKIKRNAFISQYHISNLQWIYNVKKMLKKNLKFQQFRIIDLQWYK